MNEGVKLSVINIITTGSIMPAISYTQQVPLVPVKTDERYLFNPLFTHPGTCDVACGGTADAVPQNYCTVAVLGTLSAGVMYCSLVAAGGDMMQQFWSVRSGTLCGWFSRLRHRPD